MPKKNIWEKKGMLVGHEKNQDIYQESRKPFTTWAYTGTKMKHWKDSKFWKKIS